MVPRQCKKGEGVEIINIEASKKIEKKKEYNTPRMEVIGEVIDVTQGANLGYADTGG